MTHAKLRNGLFTLMFLLLSKASAGIIDLNFLYAADALSASTSNSGSKLFYDLCLGFSVVKNNSILIGWNYANYSTSQTVGSSTTTYAATQMGPKFIFFLNRDHNWRIGVGYNVLSSADYKNGTSASESWKGMAYSIDVGYQFLISEEILFGARVNYSASTYTEKLIGTAYSNVSNTETFIYPSLAVSYLW